MDTLSSLTTAPAEALISGRAGCAIIRSGDAFFRISVDEPQPTPCDATYWSHLRALHPEGEVMRVGEHPFQDVERTLRASWSRDRALSLTLIALDAEHVAALRLQACSAAEPLLAEALIQSFLRSRLLSRAPPPDADFEGARAIAERAGARTIAQILAEVIASKEAITSVLSSWDRIVRELPTPADRAEATRDVERAGVVARFVVAVRQEMTHNERSELNSWLVAVAPTLRIPQPLVLLNRWLHDTLPKEVRRYPDARPAAEVWAFREGNAEEGRYFRLQDRGAQPQGHEAKQRVDAQKSAIVIALQQGQSSLVEHQVKQLMNDQERNGGNVFAVKSLCDLARKAENLGEIAWADRWLLDAVDRAPENEIAWVQLLTLRVRYGKSQDLLELCEQMLLHVPHSAYVLCTKAKVLRALGLLTEALEAYDEAVVRFPEDEFARTGRAEVLKAQGRLGEALAAYDETIERFPKNEFARTGRAEVLKAQGRLGEALAAYDETIERFPENDVARNGRAEVLKAQGRLGEALAAYNETIEQFPKDEFARTGRAEVLKAQGRLGEALAAYDETIERFPEDDVARNGRAEVLKAQGRLGEALAAYDHTIRRSPANVVARTGRAEVLKAQGRLGEARAAYEAVLETHPSDAYARTGLTLVLMAQGQLARAEECLQAESTPGTRSAWIRLHVRGMLALRQNQLDLAQQIFMEGRRDCPFASLHGWFQSGLALVAIRGNHPERAVAELRRSEPAVEELQQVSWALILAHALAANGDLSGAARHLARPSEVRLPVVVRLRETLARRFGVERDRDDDAQALEEHIFEDELLLLAS